jgi:hypothetical protein
MLKETRFKYLRSYNTFDSLELISRLQFFFKYTSFENWRGALINTKDFARFRENVASD